MRIDGSSRVAADACGAGHPLEQRACPSLPGALADTQTWLSQYDPYIEGVTAQRELECRDKSTSLSDLISHSGCWQTPCQLVVSALGIQRERAHVNVNVQVYLLSIGSSFTGARTPHQHRKLWACQLRAVAGRLPLAPAAAAVSVAVAGSLRCLQSCASLQHIRMFRLAAAVDMAMAKACRALKN